MQEQGRKALAYVSSLRVISGIALVPTTSGVGGICVGPIRGELIWEEFTCAVYSKDRNKVTTLKGVGQSHPHRNMLSACDIVLSFRKKIITAIARYVCFWCFIRKQMAASTLKVWTGTLAPIITLSLKRSLSLTLEGQQSLYAGEPCFTSYQNIREELAKHKNIERLKACTSITRRKV